MFCINCFHPTTHVTNSRPHKKSPSIWRRRHCTHCKTTFTTLERPSLSDTKKIALPNGRSDIFNLGKLVISIAASFTHDQQKASYDSIWLAHTVEDTLSAQYAAISPDDIAAVTHQVLKNFDELAAVQYAAKHRLIASTKRGRGRPSLSEHAPRTDESPSL